MCAQLCPGLTTDVPALPDTQVPGALMTQMNVPPHPPFARMKANAPTLQALTSVTVPLASPVDTVKPPMSRVHRRHVSMEALVRALS